MSNTTTTESPTTLKTVQTLKTVKLIHLCPRGTDDGWAVVGEDTDGKFKMLFPFYSEAYDFIQAFLSTKCNPTQKYFSADNLVGDAEGCS